MEALGEDGVLALHLAGGAGEGLLVLPDLLLQDLIHVGGHLVGVIRNNRNKLSFLND